MTIYDLAYEEDHSELYNLLSNPSDVIDPMRIDLSKVSQICFSCHLKRGGVNYREDVSFELVQFVGYFREFEILFLFFLMRPRLDFHILFFSFQMIVK